MSVDYEAPGSGSDEVEGIAGDQGKFWLRTDRQHFDLFRSDDLPAIDVVMVDARLDDQPNVHADSHAFERAKVGIAMACETDCAESAGESRSIDMADAFQETVGFDSIGDRNRELESWNLNTADHGS
jgi:hypothetical protein